MPRFNRNIWQLIIFISLIITNSCNKQKDIDVGDNGNITAQKQEVKTYEIVNLIASVNLEDRYTGKFGDKEVTLLKTSDSTLSFYIPEVPSGDAVLSFDLGKLKFAVSQTGAPSLAAFTTNFNSSLDAQINQLSSTTPEEQAEIQAFLQYKQEVFELFNSLSEDNKRQTLLFYEANKEVFQLFVKSTFSIFDGPTTIGFQSECPKTDFKSFYSCTAGNLAAASEDMLYSSIEFLKMMALAGTSAILAPASFGISAFGTTLALGTAGYLLITEVRPAFLHLKRNLTPFLKANWIFSKALFQTVGTTFYSYVRTNLNLRPKFRSLTNNDGDISQGNSKFLKAMSSLNEYWHELTKVFGALPSFNNTESETTLDTDNISISAISNSNVQYLGHEGQSASFKTTSGNTENFSYKLTVRKEGFVEEKVVNATVHPGCDDSIAILGTWKVEVVNICYPNPDGSLNVSKTHYMTLNPDGTVVYNTYEGQQYTGAYYYRVGECSFFYTGFNFGLSCSTYSLNGGTESWYMVYTPTIASEANSLADCQAGSGCLTLRYTKQ